MSDQSIAQQVEEIMESETMAEWIENVGTNYYGGGLYYQLYLDLDDNSLEISAEASSNSWRQRSDGSLVKIASYHNMNEQECEPYDDWQFHYRNEIEGNIYDALAE